RGGAAAKRSANRDWRHGGGERQQLASVILDNESNAMLALYTPECGEPCASTRKLPTSSGTKGHHVVFDRADVTPGTSAASSFRRAEEPDAAVVPQGATRITLYGGDVDLHEIVGFINDMTGSHRQPDGKLEPGAGRRRERPTWCSAGTCRQLSEEVAQAASDLPHSKRYVFYYQRLLRQLMKGSPIDRVLERENAAIDQLLNGGSGGGIAAAAR
uniref:SUI1 domain-containing protein n=1 Tax=Macrostomum lignano TaxID=282301 RepID=A0A1I8F5K4_9PLAT